MNYFFPQVCGVCGKLNENSLCRKCELDLENVAEYAIEEINEEEFYFKEHIYLFKYEGIVRKLILDYKFNDKAYIHETFVNFLLKNEKIFEKMKTYDTIIPVPISKKRKKERGYNQSLLISKQLSKKAKLQHVNTVLAKCKNNINQSKLSKEDRIKNVQGVYELRNKEILNNKKILLIDDIYTTGSTAKECCRILKEASPSKIGIFTIAKD